MHNADKLPVKQRLAVLASLLLLSGLAIQAQTTLTNGLQAYWSFDGNFYDSMLKYHGTPHGTNAVGFVDGMAGMGKALKLDGTDQYVEVTGGQPGDLAFPGGSVSIAAWFKVEAFDKSWQALVCQGEANQWRVARDSSSGTMSYAGGLTDAVGTTDVSDGNWHHIVAITDAGAAKFGTALYVDGVQDGTQAGTPALTTNSKRVLIGENPDATGRQWNGEIDDLAIWNRVLTEAEITSLYAGGKGMPLSSVLPSVTFGTVTFAQQPASTTAVVGGHATFTVQTTYTGSFPPTYQWLQNGVAIAGATAPSYTTPRLATTDNGAKFTVKASISGIEFISAEAILTVTADNIPPALASVSGSIEFTSLTVSFSEPVDPATGTNKANYSLSGGLTISAAKLFAPTGSDGDNKVVLTTSKQTPSTALTVTVSNVKDLYGNTIAANSTKDFKTFVPADGFVLQKFWDNILVNSVDTLTSDPRFPDAPTSYTLEPRWEYPPNGGNEAGSTYGNQLVGWFTPAKSGDYIFFTCSDDYSSLYLSTDDTAANKKLIAQEQGWSNPRNWTTTGSGDATAKRSDQFAGTEWPTGATITLKAGSKYYLESLHSEGSGGDNVSATFIMAGEADPATGEATKLTGSLISTYADPNDLSGGNPQPAELGQTLNGFQDDFKGATRDPNWVAVGPGGDHYVQQDGVLKVFVSDGDPNHLLYMGSGASNTVHEVLARIRVVNFSSGDPARGGLAVNVSTNVASHLTDWIGVNLNIRNSSEGTPASTVHFKLLDDLRGWGPQTTFAWTNNVWYWMRLRMDPKMDGTNTAFAKIWVADNATPEPADWQVTWKDTDMPSPKHGGYAGITGCSGGGVGQFEVDYVLIKSAGLPSIKVDFSSSAPGPTAPMFTGVSNASATSTVSINWFGGGKLQTAPAVTGAWQDITNSLPPYKVITTGAKSAGSVNFYRLTK